VYSTLKLVTHHAREGVLDVHGAAQLEDILVGWSRLRECKLWEGDDEARWLWVQAAADARRRGRGGGGGSARGLGLIDCDAGA
jgi:hypothetical protein